MTRTARTQLIVGLIVSVLVAVATGTWLLTSQAQAEHQALELYKEEVLGSTVKDAQTRLEFFYKNVYETARTISLVPGVRNITGINRANADIDVVAQGRLDKQSDIVMKNLYLNLAGNFSISEIYCVLEGLDAGKGQVPFFMYDQTIVPQADGARATDPADVPRQNEDEEYAYFPSALSELKSGYPTFDYGYNLAKIPVVYSPLMLTCDNNQYLSIKNGDPNHTRGMISSVPLYTTQGAFRGLIAVVYRVDTLTAILLNLPFLPITDADKAKAHDLFFDWPERPVPLLLSGPGGLAIGDPRDAKLAEHVATARQAKSPDLLSVGLKLPHAQGWTLNYWLGPEEKDRALAELRSVQAWQTSVVALLLVLAVALFLMLWNGARRRESLLGGLTEAVSAVGEGNLGYHLKVAGTSGSVGRLASSFQGMVSSIGAIVETLKTSLETSSSVSSDLASSAEEASVTLDEIQRSLANIGQVVVSLESIVNETMDAVFAHSQAEDTVRSRMGDLNAKVETSSGIVRTSLGSFQGVAEVMSRQLQNISTLQDSSRDARNRMEQATAQLGLVQRTVDTISGTVGLIGEITAKTKLLAMNAAIEAAHAGHSGRGFAVVSQNIRSLAEETEAQNRSIADALGDLIRTLATAREAQGWTSDHLTALLDDFERLGRELTEVATRMVDLGKGSADVLAELGATQDGSRQALESLNQMADESSRLVGKIQSLIDLSQTTTRETGQLRSAMEQVGEVVQVVSNSGARNLEGVAALVEQVERFHK